MCCLVCVCTYMYEHAMEHGWRSEDNFSGVLSFHHVDCWEIKSCQAWWNVPLPY